MKIISWISILCGCHHDETKMCGYQLIISSGKSSINEPFPMASGGLAVESLNAPPRLKQNWLHSWPWWVRTAGKSRNWD